MEAMQRCCSVVFLTLAIYGERLVRLTRGWTSILIWFSPFLEAPPPPLNLKPVLLKAEAGVCLYVVAQSSEEWSQFSAPDPSGWSVGRLPVLCMQMVDCVRFAVQMAYK